MLEFLQYISIVIELIIAIIGIALVFVKNKIYGWGIFVTFAIYVFYDFAKLTGLAIAGDLLYLLFFVATVSALYFSYSLFKLKR